MNILNLDDLQYVIRYPENYREGEKYPVILFLHGAGTRGTDIEVLKKNAFFGLTAEHADFPFVTVAPQCHSETWFDHFETLKRLVADIRASEFADPNRLYVIGASMGGYATWQLTMSMPEMFAAAVPICGGGMYWDAGRLKHVPIWAFHGDSDKTVLTEDSVKMVNAVNKKGGDAKLTIYPETGHDAWTATYKNADVFAWMLSHTRWQANTETDSGFADAKRFG